LDLPEEKLAGNILHLDVQVNMNLKTEKL